MERKKYIAPAMEILDNEIECNVLGISIDKGIGGPGIAESRHDDEFEEDEVVGYGQDLYDY